jgi:hypothetical protein
MNQNRFFRGLTSTIAAAGIASLAAAQTYTAVELPGTFAVGAYHPLSQVVDANGNRYAYSVTVSPTV